MSETAITKKPDIAFKLHSEIVAFGRQAQAEFLEMAKRLWQMKEQKLFRQLEYKSFNSYLLDAELPFAPTLGHGLVKTYQALVVKSKIKPERIAGIGQAKATMIARAIERGVTTDMDELMAEAETKPVSQLRIRLTELETGIEVEQCPHDDLKYRRCRKCYRIEYDFEKK